MSPETSIGRLPRALLHGGDYFPEQWLSEPPVLEEDLRLMKEARCTTVSIGMFAWSALEPTEGRYSFAWLDTLMDRFAAHGIRVILATPTGARPAWMSQCYPEVLRVDADGLRHLHGGRHNHCYTSPVYREKAAAVNRRLAERYGRHPALVLWHLSNEYGGECHCPLCQEAFRAWLEKRYRGDIDGLNRAWWTSFWSRTYSDWAQIQSPSPRGEPSLPGLVLDWKRFVTFQTVDFLRAESAPLRELSPEVPVTTNMMGTYPGLDYRRFAPAIDVASWNSYPSWHGSGPVFDGSFPWDPEGRDWITAAATGFTHDLMRSLKGGQPFLLMESAPTFSSWHAVHKPKRPGMHAASSLLAVAHGADSVLYFQWRTSRGGEEQFHGAVVGHGDANTTRVFREVADLGGTLERLKAVAGSAAPASAAFIFDWENRWALEAARTAYSSGSGYVAACLRHHRALWSLGVRTDVIDMEQDFSGYRLLAAPMLFMLKPGVAERLDKFVLAGGTLVATYCCSLVDESGLCFPGGAPGPLRRLLGIRVEETDGMYPQERNRLVMGKRNPLGIAGSFEARNYCDLVHTESARPLGSYGGGFYKGSAALTVNDLGRGHAFYLACDASDLFLSAFYSSLCRESRLPRATGSDLPEGVCAQVRTNDRSEFLFLLNFTARVQRVSLGSRDFRDAQTGEKKQRKVSLQPYGFLVLERGAS